MAPSTTAERKHGLSNMFSKHKEQEQPRPTLSGHDDIPSNDSAYASSETPSRTSRTSPDTQHAIPIENRGNIQGVDKDRNLAINQKGEVIDQDSGETVTVVTTTTTTTTTVMKGKNGESSTVQVETRPEQPVGGRETGTSILHVAEAPGDGPAQRLRQPSAEPPRPRPRAEDAPTPVSPVALQHPQRTMADGPPIPPGRNPDRKSREYGHGAEPPSLHANKHNFSYPSRSDLRGAGSAQATEENGYQEFQHSAHPSSHQQGSAFQNLKAAAVGLHGVGETLRGTLNSEIDNRLPRRNAEKATAANEKNLADLERGQREMARLREARSLRPTPLEPMKGQDVGYSLNQQLPDNAHPAFRQQAQGQQHPQALRPGGSGAHEGTYPQPMPQQLAQPQQQRQTTGFNRQEADRYQQHKRPLDHLRPSPAEQRGAEGYDGPVQQNGAGSVQAVSQTLGGAEAEEREQPKGLRKLFKR